MSIDTQINTLLNSIFFGIFLGVQLNILKIRYKDKSVVYYIILCILLIFNTLYYYFSNYEMNEGVINFYLIVLVYLGYLISLEIMDAFKKFRK